MKVLLVAGVALVFLTSGAKAASPNCAPIRFTVSTARPVALSEACAGTIVVNVRINHRIPYDSQGFGRGAAGLIEYGYGASVRLYQGGPDKGTLWVRAATSSPTAQTVTIRLHPQTTTS